jgi:ABC-type transporter Mla MlaB component
MAATCPGCEGDFPATSNSRVSLVSLSSSPVCRFDLDGAQTVRTIQATHQRLATAMAEHQSIEIHCNAVTELDLSLIQLVLAAKRSADRDGKSLTLAAPATGNLRTALDRAGFLATAVGESGGEIFWLNGVNAR